MTPRTTAVDPAPGANRVSGGGDLATAVVLGTLATVVMVQGWQLGLVRDGLADSGLWPFCVGALLLGASLVIALSAPNVSDDVDTAVNGSRRAAAASGLLVGFVVLFTLLGVVTATVVTVLVWLRLLARESLAVSASVALILGASIYLVFVRLLDVPLPVDAFLPR